MLSNGAVAYLVEDHVFPLVNLSVTIRTGQYLEPPDKIGLAAMTGDQIRAGGTVKRKPRDFDGELKALQDKARDLKSRKVQQLGELVIATGADSLSVDELAGALIVLTETKDAGKREAWARRGAAFFQSRARRTAPAAERHTGGARAQSGGAQPSTGSKGAA